MLDQFASVVLRTFSWLILIGSFVFAAFTIFAAGAITQATGVVSPVAAPIQVGAVLLAFGYVLGGLVVWAFLNVIASIADNLIALRESNEDLIRIVRSSRPREETKPQSWL